MLSIQRYEWCHLKEFAHLPFYYRFFIARVKNGPEGKAEEVFTHSMASMKSTKSYIVPLAILADLLCNLFLAVKNCYLSTRINKNKDKSLKWIGQLTVPPFPYPKFVNSHYLIKRSIRPTQAISSVFPSQ